MIPAPARAPPLIFPCPSGVCRALRSAGRPRRSWLKVWCTQDGTRPSTTDGVGARVGGAGARRTRVTGGTSASASGPGGAGVGGVVGQDGALDQAVRAVARVVDLVVVGQPERGQ